MEEIKEEDLTKEQKEVYDQLSTTLKAEYLQKLNNNQQEHYPISESEGERKETIDQIKEQNPAEVEKEEQKKKESAKHQKKVIKNKVKKDDEKSGSNIGKWALGTTVVAIVAYFIFGKKPLNKDNIEDNQVTTGQNTVSSNSIDYGTNNGVNDGGFLNG